MDRKHYIRTYQRKWIAERKAKYRPDKCSHCNTTGPVQLDHIDRSSKIDHKIWSWALPRLEAELAKCQWLCLKCHQDKSLEELGLTHTEHGTYSGYNNKGCRCEACKAAKALYTKNRKDGTW